MKRLATCLGVFVVIVLLLGMGLAGGVVLDQQAFAESVPADNIPSDATSDFRLMAEAWNTVHQSYVDRSAIEAQTLTYGAISGMVDALGDTGHSRFLSPEMVQEEHDFTTGQFEGIGAYVEMKDGHVVIVAPMDGSPALQAGLHPGDIILRVDGENVAGLPIDQVVSRIAGPVGSSITLTILTPDTGQTRDVTLVRARITLQNVSWQQLPGTQIAHVRIVAFSQGVTENLKKALSAIQQQGMTGIVLDLRSNPGGLLSEAVGAASQFLNNGNVLLEQNAQGDLTPVPVEDGALAFNMPLVVLIDSGTASAAEIVSGALQDAGRAKLVGETTFGTGTVLNEFPLSDGSALLLATEEWLTPRGRVIWHQGIAPDVQVSLPQDTSPLLPEAEAGMTLDQVQTSGDAQLLRAMALLSQSADGQPAQEWAQTRSVSPHGESE
jgi:carboxyl-terminal processing protease